MIDVMIMSFLAETIKTQGVTLAAVFVMMAWMMRRINFLDSRIREMNGFLMRCFEEHLVSKPPGGASEANT
jgi:enamine deaminase RidA (YjgF/YER057c/UK114 family)